MIYAVTSPSFKQFLKGGDDGKMSAKDFKLRVGLFQMFLLFLLEIQLSGHLYIQALF